MSKRIVSVLDDYAKECLYKDWFSGEYNKTTLGVIYGVSPRTVGRVIDEMTLQGIDDELAKQDAFAFLKVGDKVKINKQDCDWLGYIELLEEYVGKVGVVTELDTEPSRPEIFVEFPDYDGDGWYFDPATVEVVPVPCDDPAQDPQLEHSDYFTIVPNSCAVVCYQGETVTVDTAHPRFQAIVEACADGELELAYNMANVKRAIETFTQGDVTIEGETVKYRGEEVKDGLAQAIVRLMQKGDEGFKALVSFMEKVKQNPSYKSRMELFGFIQHYDIDILPNGNLLCWKRIRKDWKDCHTGTIDNSVGAVVKMERQDVNDNSNETCSAGLHVCAKGYLGSFHGDRVVRCEVHPKDVVSIPTDYNDMKMRCCEYKVVEEVEGVC